MNHTAARHDGAGGSSPDRLDDLAGTALGWLGEVLRSEFAAAPDFGQAAELPECSGVGGVGMGKPAPAAESWRRAWKRGWRRFQLLDQLRLFDEELDGARTPDDVYNVLSEHAVSIVGGFTCILFPPQRNSERLRPLPNRSLRFDAGRLSLPCPPPLTRTGLIAAADAVAFGSGCLSGLAPLFAEERAVSLAYARLDGGGVILLVERRHERVFEPEDWILLRALSARAAAALERLRLVDRMRLHASTAQQTLQNDTDEVDALLEHAWAGAIRGEPFTVAVLELDSGPAVCDSGGESIEQLLVHSIQEIVRRVLRARGIAVRYGSRRFLLIFPGLDVPAAVSLIESIRGRLGTIPVRSGVAQYNSDDRSALELVDRALRSCLGSESCSRTLATPGKRSNS